jgi:hypothetical protein
VHVNTHIELDTFFSYEMIELNRPIIFACRSAFSLSTKKRRARSIEYVTHSNNVLIVTRDNSRRSTRLSISSTCIKHRSISRLLTTTIEQWIDIELDKTGSNVHREICYVHHRSSIVG